LTDEKPKGGGVFGDYPKKPVATFGFSQVLASFGLQDNVVSQQKFPSKPTYVCPAVGYRGMNELHYAAYLNDPVAVTEQLQLGVSVDSRDDNGWTPLHWSIDMSQAWGEPDRVVALLLKAGASANAVDSTGQSVLMIACGRNNEKIVEKLLDAGADINVRNDDTTPLHEAASCNFVEAIERLLSLGADSYVLDRRGLTPEQLAEECEFVECCSVFKKNKEEK
jgi:26S proteasome non-ATPase regulatory subunit 10